MRVSTRITSSPLWIMLPSVVLVCVLGGVVSRYEPLLLDPSVYTTTQALAAESALMDVVEPEVGEPEATTLSTAEADTDGRLTDGIWTGYAVCGEGNPHGWSPYYVAVTIEVAEGKVVRILSIEGGSTAGEGSGSLSWNPSESQAYLNLAANGHSSNGLRAQMDAQIAAGGRVTNVDAVSGATYSSVAIYTAYQDAVSQAGGNASGGAAQGLHGMTLLQDQAPSTEGTRLTTASQSSHAQYQDGLWMGCAVCGDGNDGLWDPYYVWLAIRVTDGKVADITDACGRATGEVGDKRLLWNANESQRYLDWAAHGRTKGGMKYVGVLEQMLEAVSKSGAAQGTIDVVSGATFSSKALVKAYSAALAKSAAEAGAEVVGDGGDVDDRGSGDEPSDDNKPGEDGSPGDSGAVDDPAEGGEPTDPDPGEDQPVPPSLVDGIYTGYGWCEDPAYEDDWDPYYVLVSIEVKDGVVSAVQSIAGDTQGVVDPAFRFDTSNATYLTLAINGNARVSGMMSRLPAELDAEGNVVDVDTVSGATFSSKAILEGYAHAVSQAQER